LLAPWLLHFPRPDKNRHLKPGVGWLEHVEIDMQPRCDDGSLPMHSELNYWTRCVLDATGRNHRPLAYNEETRSMLDAQGFVEVQEQIFKVPLNPWPADAHLKDVGRWYNLGLTQGLEALTMGPLSKMSNWSIERIDKLVADVKREICSKRHHVYCYM
jgi:hypothetical protein